MSAIKNHYHDEIEERALYEDCVNDNEFFELCDEHGVEEITWSKSLNNDYMNWIYLNIK